MRAAYWIGRTHLFEADEYVCSSCGCLSERPYKVCPNCQKPMKKVKYDASWVDEAEGMSALLDDDW